jgi:hypothetical protein
LYKLNEHPFGLSWKKWTALWCKWILSIPKDTNPALDITGRHCAVNQKNEKVWFLTGTFGNIVPIKRKCNIPVGKAVFFPVLVKEDSLAEDIDLKTDDDLVKRSRDATDELLYISASIDNKKIEDLENYRIQSEVFDLSFPNDNVYGVKPGLTRSVCDGFWLFIKPLEAGKHYIHFKGETAVVNNTIRTFLINNAIYSPIEEHIRTPLSKGGSTFKLDVSYEVTISN